MGAYHIRYQIKIPVPDLASPSDGMRLGMETLVDEQDVIVDSITEQWLKRQRMKIIVVSILAGLVPFSVIRRAPLAGETLPLYVVLLLSIAQGLVYWLVFSWILDTYYLKPRLARMLPEEVQGKGLIRILEHTKIKE